MSEQAEPVGRWMEEGIPTLLNHRLGAEEVVQLYRIVLGRDPESPEVIDRHMQTNVTIADFLRTLLLSPEFVARQRDLAAEDIVHRIDLDGSPEQMQRLMAHIRGVWTNYGETDPYWSVLTNAAFKLEVFDGIEEERFYASGADDAGVLLALADEHRLDLPVEGRVLDFGCGVGRVGQHLSKMFDAYDGLDISASHLRIAAGRFAKLGQSNARFRSLTDFLDGDDEYDCVFSVLVLQHNPPPVIAFLIRRLLASLRPGGVAYFQVPCAVASYEFDLADYLAHIDSEPTMEMHAIPHHAVEDVVRGAGCRLIVAQPDGRIVPRARSYVFLVQRDEPAATQ